MEEKDIDKEMTDAINFLQSSKTDEEFMERLQDFSNKYNPSKNKVVWHSRIRGTYVKEIHGSLKEWENHRK